MHGFYDMAPDSAESLQAQLGRAVRDSVELRRERDALAHELHDLRSRSCDAYSKPLGSERRRIMGMFSLEPGDSKTSVTITFVSDDMKMKQEFRVTRQQLFEQLKHIGMSDASAEANYNKCLQAQEEAEQWKAEVEKQKAETEHIRELYRRADTDKGNARNEVYRIQRAAKELLERLGLEVKGEDDVG